MKLLAILVLCLGLSYEYRFQGNQYYLRINNQEYWGTGVPRWMKTPYSVQPAGKRTRLKSRPGQKPGVKW